MVEVSNVKPGDMLTTESDLMYDRERFIVELMFEFAGGTYEVVEIGSPFNQSDVYIRLATGNYRYWWHPSILYYNSDRDTPEFECVDMHDLIATLYK